MTQAKYQPCPTEYSHALRANAAYWKACSAGRRVIQHHQRDRLSSDSKSQIKKTPLICRVFRFNRALRGLDPESLGRHLEYSFQGQKSPSPLRI